MVKPQSILKILKFLIFTACLVHVATLVISELNPTLPVSKIYSQQLKALEFPLVIQLCALKISRENEHFEMYGYANMMNFYKGLSLYNDSLIGWSGFSKNGSTLGSPDGKEK